MWKKTIGTLLFMSSLTLAHDFWLQLVPSGATLRYGHGQEEESYRPEKVKKATALDASGRSTNLQPNLEQGRIRLASPSDSVQLGVEIDNGYWSKNVSGWANRSKSETPGCLLSEWSHYYAKVLLKPQECLGRSFGHPLEIVPLKVSPERLQVRILHDGKPVPQVKVYSNHKKVAESNEQGEAEWGRSGETVVSVGLKSPLQGNPHADRLNLHACLTVP